jgi:hypothetical protein
MPSLTKVTTDHGEIRQWVESHGGHPATVKSTHRRGDLGIIRIDFPGYSGGGTLEAISWDEWFEKFDDQELAFVHQDKRDSNFNKLIRRAPPARRTAPRRRRARPR